VTDVIEVTGLVKRYPGVVANRDVNLRVSEGTIHAVIGENGAGKSTLMKMLYGMVKPDEGTITVGGKAQNFRGPQDAIQAGIGMVHQHFMLADNATVLENVILGSEPSRFAGAIDFDAARAKFLEITQKYGLAINPDDLVADLTVGGRQRVEIAKVLFRGARILILDEPTAVLVPQEVDELFENLKDLIRSGLTVLFISHKLQEVLGVSSHITVMRQGTTVASLSPGETSAKELAELMVGRQLPQARATQSHVGDKRVLEIRDAHYRRADGRESLKSISLTLNGGEILGIAGVEGNGQTELVELILGLIKPQEGTVAVLGKDTAKATTRTIRDSGVGYIPQDRSRDALLLPESLWQNRILGHQSTAPMSKGMWISKSAAQTDSERIVEQYDVRTPSIRVAAAALSGGNQQKFIVGREMSGSPDLLVAAQPTRGVDVGAQSIIWEHLLDAKEAGAGVLLVSADLDELFALSDRIAVIFSGEIVAELSPSETTPELLGLAMTGAKSA
jgi:general nucleoside transport system ATP-binding protein